jgi:hypothetical protein
LFVDFEGKHKLQLSVPPGKVDWAEWPALFAGLIERKVN